MAGEPVNDQLETLLSKLEIEQTSSLWELKQAIWKRLNISVAPVKVKNQRKAILDSNFNNAADIPILRNREGRLLLTTLCLDLTATKERLESAIVVAVEASDVVKARPATIPNKPPKGNRKPNIVNRTSIQYERDKEVVNWVRSKAEGYCECCGTLAPFTNSVNEPYLEVHHVRTLAEGGSDTTSNTVAVCPNCHRALHHSIERDKLVATLYRKIGRLKKE